MMVGRAEQFSECLLVAIVCRRDENMRHRSFYHSFSAAPSCHTPIRLGRRANAASALLILVEPPMLHQPSGEIEPWLVEFVFNTLWMTLVACTNLCQPGNLFLCQER